MQVGPYTIEREVGRGGLGVVFLARGPRGERVAVKVLIKLAPEARVRFAREVRLLSGLGEAEGFVPLLDAGETPHGPWLAMPFLEGGTLRDRMAGRLEVGEVVPLGIALARALGAAHERGIVHRDVKPENVLFRGERPLLADLGIARHFDRALPGGSASFSLSGGEMRGTPGYMAPEQIEAGAIGPPADVFALGVVLYEALAGRPPFEGATLLEHLAVNQRAVHEPLEGVPRWLARVVERCLAVDPRRRYASGHELARALARGGAARSPVVPVALGLLALAALAAVFWPRGRVREQPESAAALAREAHGLLRKDRARAEALLARAVAKEPRSGVVLTVRGELRFGREDLAGALEDANAAVEAAPEHAPAWALRGALVGIGGELAAGIADLTRALVLDPGLAEAWMNRANLLRAIGETDAALADVDRSIACARFPEPLLLRGSMRQAGGDAAGALEDFGRALALDPDHGPSLRARGALLVERGERAAAVADLRRASELAPRDPLVWSTLANALHGSGDAAGAFAAMERAFALGPEDARLLGSRARLRYLTGDHPGAVSDATRAIELDGQFAIAWYYRGVARDITGDIGGGIADLTRAIQLDPKMAVAWEARAWSRGRLDDIENAVADAAQAIILGGRTARTLTVLAMGHYRAGRLDAAIESADAALALDPRQADAWNYRGVSVAARDPERAVADFTRAIELDPKRSMFRMNRGLARKGRDSAGAIEDGLAAVELDPGQPVAWLNLASIYSEAGRHEEADAAVTKAIELRPDFVQAVYNRGVLRDKRGDPRAKGDFARVLELGGLGAEVDAWLREKVR